MKKFISLLTLVAIACAAVYFTKPKDSGIFPQDKGTTEALPEGITETGPKASQPPTGLRRAQVRRSHIAPPMRHSTHRQGDWYTHDRNPRKYAREYPAQFGVPARDQGIHYSYSDDYVYDYGDKSDK